MLRTRVLAGVGALACVAGLMTTAAAPASAVPAPQRRAGARHGVRSTPGSSSRWGQRLQHVVAGVRLRSGTEAATRSAGIEPSRPAW